MELYQLKPSHGKKSRKRVGRGGKRGTYSGKGMKGQKSRSGKSPRASFGGGDTTFAKRLPKRRGTVGKVKVKRGVKNFRLRSRLIALNLKDIEKHFKDNEIVSYRSLLKKGLIQRVRGKVKIKILGEGKGGQKLVFKGVGLSKSAQEKTGTKIKAKKKVIKLKKRRAKKKTKEAVVKKAVKSKKTKSNKK